MNHKTVKYRYVHRQQLGKFGRSRTNTSFIPNQLTNQSINQSVGLLDGNQQKKRNPMSF